MPKHGDMNKILVIGSGPVIIGQAGELDQAGAQTCDALRSMGCRLVIAHSDPASIMTDLPEHDQIYIEPLEINTLLQIIASEKPDALLATVGGQTALNLAEALAENGVLSQNNINLLGLSPLALKIAVDRKQLKMLPLPSDIAHSRALYAASTAEAAACAEQFGYPVVIRPVISEPGLKNAIAYNVEDLQKAVKACLTTPNYQQIILEESLVGCREIEVIVARDRSGGKIVWASLENMDPVGIHHGDSAVAIPVQSIPADQLGRMEAAACALADALAVAGIVGVRYAYRPDTHQIVLLGITPRASRSTALANLAAGISIYQTAALLAAGMLLSEMDWLSSPDDPIRRLAASRSVVKLPCWAFDTFKETPDRLDIHMQSIGEVVGIGEDFDTAFMKAMACSAMESATCKKPTEAEITADHRHPGPLDLLSSKRYLHLATSLESGETISELNRITGIAPLFLNRIKALSGRADNRLLAEKIASPLKKSLPQGARESSGAYLMIGPGLNELGHGLGFDHSSIQAAKAVIDAGHAVVRINCNAASAVTRDDSHETVYVEPLTIETVAAIYAKEKAQGIFFQFCGPRIAQMAPLLAQAGMRLIGTALDAIEILNDNGRFRSMIRELGIAQPDFEIVGSHIQLFDAVERIGYPVLIRPEKRSFGKDAETSLIIMDPQMLSRHFNTENNGELAQTLIVERFLEYAIECEADILCDGREVFIPTVLEHIELAGVNPADSACVTPPYSTPLRHVETLCEYTRKIVERLEIKGIMNLRFAILNDTVYVLEATPWANRTLSFTSKICNIPMAYAAAQILLGKSLAELDLKRPLLPFFSVREAVFPFADFPQVDPLLGPQLYSTGSVLALDDSFGLAYYKSQEAMLMPLPLSGSVLITVTDADKPSILEPARLFKEMGFTIKATKGTLAFLQQHGIESDAVRKLGFGRPNLVDAIKTGEIDLVINTPSGKQSQIDDADIRKAAIQRRVPNITTPAGAIAAAKGIAARLKGRPKVKSLGQYYNSRTSWS